MKLQLVSVVALAMTTTAGISNAQDNMAADLNQPVIQSPEADAFTPMTREQPGMAPALEAPSPSTSFGERCNTAPPLYRTRTTAIWRWAPARG
jgi:hypothetical protein